MKIHPWKRFLLVGSHIICQRAERFMSNHNIIISYSKVFEWRFIIFGIWNTNFSSTGFKDCYDYIEFRCHNMNKCNKISAFPILKEYYTKLSFNFIIYSNELINFVLHGKWHISHICCKKYHVPNLREGCNSDLYKLQAYILFHNKIMRTFFSCIKYVAGSCGYSWLSFLHLILV